MSSETHTNNNNKQKSVKLNLGFTISLVEYLKMPMTTPQ